MCTPTQSVPDFESLGIRVGDDPGASPPNESQQRYHLGLYSLSTIIASRDVQRLLWLTIHIAVAIYNVACLH